MITNTKLKLIYGVLVMLATAGSGRAESPSQSQSEGVTRIHFGSCIKQDQPMPILETILEDRPELFLFLGDNIYADTSDMDEMREKYARLAADSGFSLLRATCPVMAVWDDHDYGVNDGGADFAGKHEAEEVFLNFWGEAVNSERRKRDGVYDSAILGPEGRRVQIVLLDTRFFRSSLETGERRVGGPYYPDNAEGKTMLGEAQWQWLAGELRKPAELRLLVTGIQFLAEAAGQETWSNLPRERQRLIDLIKETDANGVVFLSGDRHWADLSLQTDGGVAYPLYDLTSSSLNQLHKRGTPTQNRFRVAGVETFHRENFGVLEIDWREADPAVILQVLDGEAKIRIEKRVRLADLRAKP